MGRVVIRNGLVVNGDGRTLSEAASLVLEGDRVEAILHGEAALGRFESAERVIEAAGKVIMPGVINNHAHGVAVGPFQPNAQVALPRERVLSNLDDHLLEGSTTLLSVDGFITPEEVVAMGRLHSLTLKSATSNTPHAREAAEIVDGAGLTDYHRACDADRALDRGAIALGEIGSGFTLAGGGQDYVCIPAAIKQATGREVTPLQAGEIKIAVLGRYGTAGCCDPEQLRRALTGAGLANLLNLEQARELIERTVLPSFDAALAGMREAGAVARRRGVALIGHSSAPTRQVLLELAEQGTRLVAGHSNHPTFTVEEAVETARALRRLGATIDVATLDTFGARRLVSGPDLLFAMFRAGVVDTVSTDYAAGFHDGILLCLERALAADVLDLARAVRLATANVADAVPGLAPNRGRLSPGLVADVVITARHALSQVDTVLIGGEVVVEQGQLAAGSVRSSQSGSAERWN